MTEPARSTAPPPIDGRRSRCGGAGTRTTESPRGALYSRERDEVVDAAASSAQRRHRRPWAVGDLVASPYDEVELVVSAQRQRVVGDVLCLPGRSPVSNQNAVDPSAHAGTGLPSVDRRQPRCDAGTAGLGTWDTPWSRRPATSSQSSRGVP